LGNKEVDNEDKGRTRGDEVDKEDQEASRMRRKRRKGSMRRLDEETG
jgi:hypothetical protein